MTDERIVAYLLSELPEEESERFEEECFAEENWPEQLTSVEEDLIDAYLRDELPPPQRQRFEQNYLTTEARRRRVALAAALLRHVDTLPVEDAPLVPSPRIEPGWAERLSALWKSQNWWLPVGVGAAAIAIMAGALWFSLSRAPAIQTIATPILTITVESNRAEGIQAAKISRQPGAEKLRIPLKLPEGLNAGERYRVELLNGDGDVTSLGVNTKEGERATVEIPAAQLTRGQNSLRLYAVKPDGTEQRVSGNYFFIVE
jgi:anti-sigma-K factor RskA